MAQFDQRQQSVQTQYNVGRDLFQEITVISPTPPSPAEAQDRRNLTILLHKVKTFWIEGVLEKSVYHEVLLALGKAVDLAAVEHPWEQVLELPGQAAQTLPPDRKISDIFAEMNRAMLILGEPGSGKTMTMLELARELIGQVETDPSFSRPVPVVFNLSAWAREQSLIDWLTAELSVKYQIPRGIGRPWLEANRILPLLDGLDEVRGEDRAACVEAINLFGQTFGLAGLVVCSRLNEYTALPVRLKLNGAIRLQPLTPAQVTTYLDRAGPALEPLRLALQQDEPLRELAQSPLMLNIMSLAYQGGQGLGDPSLETVETRRQHLFDTYIAHMFNRKGKTAKPYADRQTITWLSWLAKNMRQHHQSIFLIERMQPSWFDEVGQRGGYVLGSRLIQGGLVGLLGGLVFGLIDEMYFSFRQQPSGWITNLQLELRGELLLTLGEGLLGGLLVGLLVGLSLALLDLLQFEPAGPAEPSAPVLSPRQATPRGLAVGFLAWLLGGLLGWPSFDLSAGLIFGLSNGLIFGLRGRQQSLSNDIRTVERLRLSWPGVFKGAGLGLLLGLLFGLLVGLLVGGLGSLLYDLIFGYGLARGMLYGLGIGLSFGLAGAVFAGLSSIIIELRSHPNQGIRLSIKNAGLTGLLAGLLSGGLFGLVYGLLFGSGIGVTIGLIVGLSIGLMAALWYGIFDVIQHYLLRLILWLNDEAPRDYVHFLDYAAERAFLRKVGGGYIFIHRELLEHFAETGLDPLAEPGPTRLDRRLRLASRLLLLAIFLTTLTFAGLAAHHFFQNAALFSMVEDGRQLAQAGDIPAALALYAQAEAQLSDPNLAISAGAWNSLCWYGTLWNQAAEVSFACERALALDPDNASYRDSRGLARALLGDYDGAAADFAFFIEWSKQNDQYEPYGRRREAWLAALQAGQNPFDAATLAELRNE